MFLPHIQYSGRHKESYTQPIDFCLSPSASWQVRLTSLIFLPVLKAIRKECRLVVLLNYSGNPFKCGMVTTWRLSRFSCSLLSICWYIYLGGTHSLQLNSSLMYEKSHYKRFCWQSEGFVWWKHLVEELHNIEDVLVENGYPIPRVTAVPVAATQSSQGISNPFREIIQTFLSQDYSALSRDYAALSRDYGSLSKDYAE